MKFKQAAAVCFATLVTAASTADAAALRRARPVDDCFCKVKELIGTNVKSPAGESLGDIKDFVVDVKDSRIAYAVLSFGGFLGMGDKLFAVPIAALRANPTDKVYVLSIEKEKLKSATGFDKDRWPDMADRNWAANIYKTYEVEPYWGKRDEFGQPTTERQLVRASKMIGFDVKNPQGENLGDIEDIVIEGKDGRVAYTVISFGGFLGMGDKLFAMPLSALRLDPTKDVAVVDVPKDRLKSAPGFDKKHWPDPADRKWVGEMNSFYGTKPYWDSAVSDRRDTYDRTRDSVDRTADKFRSGDALAGFPVELTRASKLIGCDVESPRGENLGDIAELVIDPKSGRVAYSLVSVGGFLGMGDKWIAVPLAAFRPKSGDDGKLVLNVDKEQLKSAPAITKQTLPSPSDRQYLTDLYAKYGCSPQHLGD